MPLSRLLTCTAALVLLAGCETSPDDAPDDTSVEASADTTADTTAGVSYDAIIVGPRGVTVVDGSGVSTEVGIGTAEADARAALVPLLGEPSDEGAYDACGADPAMRYVTWPGGLTLNVGSDGTVAGWQARGDDDRIQTASGVQLGAPLDLAQAADASLTPMEGSTLGNEFTLGSDGEVVGGFMSDAGEAGRVDGLYAGGTCFAR